MKSSGPSQATHSVKEWPLEAPRGARGKRVKQVASGEHGARHTSLFLLFLLLTPFSVAQAGTVRGTVKNGTTGQIAAGVELTLVQPMGGMQEVAQPFNK